MKKVTFFCLILLFGCSLNQNRTTISDLNNCHCKSELSNEVSYFDDSSAVFQKQYLSFLDSKSKLEVIFVEDDFARSTKSILTVSLDDETVESFIIKNDETSRLLFNDQDEKYLKKISSKIKSGNFLKVCQPSSTGSRLQRFYAKTSDGHVFSFTAPYDYILLMNEACKDSIGRNNYDLMKFILNKRSAKPD